MTVNYLSINKGQLDSQSGNVLVAQDAGSIATVITDATTADTDVGTVVTNTATVDTDLATVLTDYDAIGAAIVAISGDTYSNTTHQFTTGGSTGLTSSQLHTQMTSLNAMMTAFLTAQTAATTANTNATTAKTATAATVTAAAAIAYSTTADFILSILMTNSPDRKDAILAMEAFKNYILSNGVPGGRVGTDLPVL